MPSTNRVTRIYVEKKTDQALEANSVFQDLRATLGLTELKKLRILIRYDMESLAEEVKASAFSTIFSEPPVDILYSDDFPRLPDDFVFSVELLPGQYDQRADSAAQCVQLLSGGERSKIRVAKTYVLSGKITLSQQKEIVSYMINPVDSRQADETLPETLEQEAPLPADVPIIGDFRKKTEEALGHLGQVYGLAMSREDLLFCQKYFREEENRDPTLAELRLLDTYWSDHCRHTTFTTIIDQVEIDEGQYSDPIRNAWKDFTESAKQFFDPEQELTLMRLATFSAKFCKSKGLLNDLEESGEINACSIVRPVEVNGHVEPWLVMFKNETHNHPTEIEPFGGAATCLGGAIRDPLSGRSYVYQAMRITGAADPRQTLAETLPGKLPQRKITREAAAGYSAYGNQIGLSTGLVHEYYHPGYVAKRMEVGAVIGAVPQEMVRREEPSPGDCIILLGGRTGRDGIGGATGSSKTHTESSLETAGSEVQKGNPLEERKLQRLFRNPAFTRLVKKSNDFGAGGVSVAVGELAAGLEIDLDKVPKKYDGLDGTELAVSESQERMAIVVSEGDVAAVMALADSENLEANVIAHVTDQARLRMKWRGKYIADLSRAFIDSSGVQQHSTVQVVSPDSRKGFFDPISVQEENEIKDSWLNTLSDLNVCSQQGLNERFDNTIGAATVHMPYGGSTQQSPTEAMVAKLPVLEGETTTASAMSFGFDPFLSQWSPFHGGVYAVVEALSKIVAVGAEFHSVRFSLQEYFEKLGKDPRRWGKPLAALLGANYALNEMGLAAIGGKDSMSGSFNHLDVPPTLIAFAVTTLDVQSVISPEFKEHSRPVFLLETPIGEDGMPDLSLMTRHFDLLTRAIGNGWIASARAVHRGGIATALSKMVIGNNIGIKLSLFPDNAYVFKPLIGSILFDWRGTVPVQEYFSDCNLVYIGSTIKTPHIDGGGFSITTDEILFAMKSPLQDIFPQGEPACKEEAELSLFTARDKKKTVPIIGKPRVVIPAFPGTNCEYDCQAAFHQAGAVADILVFCNQKPKDINASLFALAAAIDNAQILMLPGGFSAGDEPDGSGKFIAAVLRNPLVYEAIERLMGRQGLILGICNGFQALIKTGLIPYGKLLTPQENSPTLTFNHIGRHISRIVHTRVVSTLSPWLWNRKPGDTFQIAISHGEGMFLASGESIRALSASGQIATQYVSADGLPGNRYQDNPNGSLWAIEGLTSPNGLIFGKMGHNERYSRFTLQNIPGEKDDRLFSSGVDFFR